MNRSLGAELARRFSEEVQRGKSVVTKNINSKDPLKRRAARNIDGLAMKILRAHRMRASNSQLRFLQKNLEEILFSIGSKAAEPKTKGEFVVSEDLLKSISTANKFAQKDLSRLFERKLRAKLKAKPKGKRRKK